LFIKDQLKKLEEEEKKQKQLLSDTINQMESASGAHFVVTH
jgi:hypothetical protein